jgi:hypothetical protein
MRILYCTHAILYSLLHLMERRQHITPDGHYVKGPPPAAANANAANANAANANANANAADAGTDAGTDAAALVAKKKGSGGGAKDSKAHYITMMKVRVALVSTAAGALSKVR